MQNNITIDWLTLNKFKLIESHPFEDITMPYYVRESILLFFNTPLTEYNNSYLIGYAEMRQGKYKAVTFRWVSEQEDVIKIYEAITGDKF
jgi:hypothetical protein